MKRKIGLVALLSLALVLTGCTTQGASSKEVFRVGMEANYSPFNWTQVGPENGGVKIEGSAEYAGGYDVEIAQRIAEGLGRELVIIKIEWDGLTPSLISGKIDAIIAGMSPTADKKLTIDFSDIYYQSDLVIVVKSGGPYENASSLQDFTGARITAQLNTFHYTVIDQIPGVVKETAMDNFSAMRVALQAGFIDGYVSERPEGVSAEAANPDFRMVQFQEGFQTSFDDTAVAVGLRKGSDLTARINEVLNAIPLAERLRLMERAIQQQPAFE